jgi:ADP-ribosylglycohydrolase
MDQPMQDRALGALYGLAVGDALGMPTQSLPRPLIVQRYGVLVEDFYPGPPDHPLAAGLAAGSITDDTEQAIVLAKVLIEGHGTVDARLLAERLIDWERSMRDRGSLDLLGPSTSRALAELLDGADISVTGRLGTTNGAAMRIAPIGVATASSDLSTVVARVVQASAVTHNTDVALSGAAAVATTISAGIDGATLGEAINLGTQAAELGAQEGHWVAGADVAARTIWALDLVRGLDIPKGLSTIYRLVGTSLATQESVPAAFAVLSISAGDPWLAGRLGASVGGDCDTIAAMAGAMAGAIAGVGALPGHARDTIDRVNHLDLAGLSAALLELR